MNPAAAFARLRDLGVPVVSTSDAAAVLGLSPSAAAKTLRRLEGVGLVTRLRHGQVWIPSGAIDPWVALEYVSAPYPAYGSLYSALYLRGALSQIPADCYAVTLGRSHRVRAGPMRYSLHQVAPELFGGFEVLPSGAKLATVEKALFDLAYLAGTRSRLFARPPELELPRRLDRAELVRWLGRIRSRERRTRVGAALDRLLPPRRPLRRPSRASARGPR